MINEETETQIKQDMDNIKSFLDEIFYSIMEIEDNFHNLLRSYQPEPDDIHGMRRNIDNITSNYFIACTAIDNVVSSIDKTSFHSET